MDQPDLSFDVKIPLQNTLLKIRLYCKRLPCPRIEKSCPRQNLSCSVGIFKSIIAPVRKTFFGSELCKQAQNLLFSPSETPPLCTLSVRKLWILSFFSDNVFIFTTQPLKCIFDLSDKISGSCQLLFSKIDGLSSRISSLLWTLFLIFPGISDCFSAFSGSFSDFFHSFLHLFSCFFLFFQPDSFIFRRLLSPPGF